MTQHSPQKMGLTTLKQVAVAALAGGALGVFVLTLFELAGAFPPVVPWSVPAVLLVMAVLAVVYASSLKRRLEKREVPALEAVRALGIAKSMVMTGAVLAGGHLVYVARWLGQLEASQPAARVVNGSVTLLVALLFAAAGYWLERACVVPDDPEDPTESTQQDPASC